jgi:hypothetical protein
MYSIFGFWKNIVNRKEVFRKSQSLAGFPYDYSLFSYAQTGRGFPNFSIRLNKNKSTFAGGELIKLKSRNDYLIAPFKSSIPTGKMRIKFVIDECPARKIEYQMRNAGDEVFSLEEREVYYLVRGKRGDHQKICLVHGSFFETIDVKELIRQSFAQVLEEKLAGSNISDEDMERLGFVFSEQEDFSRVRHVENASVKLRFRILTEVKPEGNILNPKQHPEIGDDTLNFIVPYHSEEEKYGIFQKMETVMGRNGMKKFKVFSLKHPLNGWFVVFQVNL